MPDTLTLAALYEDWDHIDGAAHIITETVKRCADILAQQAAQEPDQTMQRRTVLSETAHALRLQTYGH